MSVFGSETRELISDLLELFAKARGIPVAIYEQDSKGIVHCIADVPADIFPAHCKALWKIGTGETVCRSDMINRAAEGFRAKEWKSYTCHAGLTTEIHPIIIDEKVIAVLQCGAYVNREENDGTERKDRHLQAMKRIGADSIQSAEIEKLLFDEQLLQNGLQTEWLRKTVIPILERIIFKHLRDQENKSRIQQAAFHDIQLQVQAALAYAEDHANEIEDSTRVDEDLVDSAKKVVGKVEAVGMVLQNLMRGKYLPDKYHFNRYNIREIINQSISLCHPLATEKKIFFKQEFVPDIPRIMLQISELHLQQAFNNLIHNAVKYSYSSKEYGRRFVLIRGGYSDKGFRITISNFGIGIGEDEYDQVFVEGYKSRHQKDEYRTGSGQGLALTKRIVEQHGGKISVNSRPIDDATDDPKPYRTKFIVWLPQSQYRVIN